MTGHQRALCYVDDFLFITEPDRFACQSLINKMNLLCSELGVPIATEKTEGPASSLTFLGINLDSVSQTISLPPGKSAEIQSLLKTWSTKKKCSKTELQSLIGSLQFASKCVPAGRLFTRRMISLLTESKNIKSIKITNDFKLDLNWWISFLPAWNGTASFLCPNWSVSSSLDLFTDASSLGCGGYFAGHWFSIPWPDWISLETFSIEFLEIIPIYIACILWSDQFINQRVSFSCDNLGACQAWAKLGSSSSSVLHLMRLIASVSAVHNFVVRIIHIPGLDNTIADSLSRLDLSRFRQVAPHAADYPSPIPLIFPSLQQAYISQKWTCKKSPKI